ncbi:hypothetical protein GJ744_005864 [Endocarpon pusillum]|uniref:Uncharacterized protein n=1 Tax=Endocarpon pusillum TaxID=364733 RepID=A0A8H7AM97_9EURO|nr:hypothetical protein GJ744_005864 [Endocarpon pusillum]
MPNPLKPRSNGKSRLLPWSFRSTSIGSLPTYEASAVFHISLTMVSISTILSPKPLCPAVDGFGVARSCFYMLKDLPIWTKARGDESSLPVILSHRTPTLQVVIDPPGIYTLLGSIDGQPITDLTQVTPSPSGVIVTLLGAKVPRWISGQVDWVLTNTSTKEVTTLHTKLELYILHDPVPSFFDNSGIPLSLLRWLSTMTLWMKSDIDWISFIINALFTNPFLEYETFKGVSKYTSYNLGPYNFSVLHGVVTNCWLELFLSDMKGAMERADQTKYAINCYDMTALAQTFLALGTDSANIRAKYMEPVGFLLGTNLIGRKDTTPNHVKNPKDLCNNPFYGCPGYSKQMLCEAQDETRSPLSNHMFLAQNRDGGPVVLDACCGPQRGDVLLSAYATTIIDRQVPRIHETPGSLADIYDGPGVSALAVSAFFDPKLGPGFLFLESMMKTLSQFGTPQNPCFGLPTSNGAVTMTFTLKPHPSMNFTDDTWTINILRFPDRDDLQANYNERGEMLKNREELGRNEIANLACKGGFRMFHNDTHFVLGIVESRFQSSANLAEICNEIEALVRSFPPLEDEPADKALEAPSTPLKEGDVFSVNIKTRKKEKDWWKGYGVDTTYGNALFLNTTLGEKTHGVTFNFLARRKGPDNIQIVLIGPFLESEDLQCAVMIQ